MSESGAEVPQWVGRVTLGAVGLVAAAAAVASVEHLAELARLAGQEDERAWLLPAAVDGLVVASTMTLFTAQRTGHSADWVTWLSLALGLVASIVGNVVAVHPDLVDTEALKVAVGATPPIALALALHQALHQVRPVRSPPESEPAPAPVATPKPAPLAPALPAPPKLNGTHPKANGQTSSRVEELLPKVRQIRDDNGGKLPGRDALRAALAGPGERGPSNDTLQKVKRRLDEETAG